MILAIESEVIDIRYISASEYDKKMKKIKRDNISIQRLESLKEEKDKVRKKGKRKLTTSKLVLWTMVAFTGITAIWFMYESHRLCDISQAYALLGIVGALVPVIWKYYSKSEAENTSGGIIYDTAMRQNNIDDEEGVG